MAVDEIHILNPIQKISVRRNEVNKTFMLDSIVRATSRPGVT